MTPEKILEIEKRARKVSNAAGEFSTAVDLEKVVIAHELTIKKKPMEDAVSGFLMAKGNSGIIVVNQNHHPNRQRFTIAHEIGHFFLHHKKQAAQRLFYDTKISMYPRADSSSSFAEQSETTPEQEHQANVFASALLMPKDKIEEIFIRKGMVGDESDISMLATYFQVSEIAMSIRLKNLNL
jgi:Zn-dependent peptidase ImmA (M78 family)